MSDETPDSSPVTDAGRRVTREVEVEAATDEVWSTLAEPELRALWLDDDDARSRELRLDEVDDGRRLVWTWWQPGHEAAASTVGIVLAPTTGGTRVTSRRRSPPRDRAWPRRPFARGRPRCDPATCGRIASSASSCCSWRPGSSSADLARLPGHGARAERCSVRGARRSHPAVDPPCGSRTGPGDGHGAVGPPTDQPAGRGEAPRPVAGRGPGRRGSGRP